MYLFVNLWSDIKSIQIIINIDSRFRGNDMEAILLEPRNSRADKFY
jgi:hypothetical protein